MFLRLRALLVKSWGLGLLGVAGLVLSVLWLNYPHTFAASDPWAYAKLAEAVRTGTFRSAHLNIFAARIGVFVPTAVAFMALGVTPHSAACVPFLALLVTLVSIWFALPDQTSRAIGAILTVTCIPMLDGAMELMPDLVGTAGVAASMTVLCHRRRVLGLSTAQGAAWATFGATAWLWAFFAKETAYFSLLVWGGVLVSDLRGPDRDLLKRFHLPAALVGVAGMSAYLAWCHRYFGHALARVRFADALSGSHTWARASHSALLRRITWAPFSFFWNEYGVLGVLALPSAFFGLRRGSPVRVWSCLTLVSVLLFWGGSTALARYQPLPLMSRMALPLAPGAIVVVAWALSRFRLPELRSEGWRVGVLLAFVAALFVPRLVRWVKAWKPAAEVEVMDAAVAFVKEESSSSVLLVTAAPRTASYLPIYFGFAPPERVRFVFAGDLSRKQLEEADRVLLFSESKQDGFYRSRGYRVFDREFKKARSKQLAARGGVWLGLDHDRHRLVRLLVRDDP